MLGWRNYRHKSLVERHRKSLFLPYFYSDRRAILFSECVRGYWDHLGEIDAVGELICTSRQEWCGGFFGTSNAFQRPHLLLSHQLEIGPPFTQKALLLKLWCKKYKLQREVVPRQRPGCLGLGGKATRRRTELATSGGRESLGREPGGDAGRKRCQGRPLWGGAHPAVTVDHFPVPCPVLSWGWHGDKDRCWVLCSLKISGEDESDSVARVVGGFAGAACVKQYGLFRLHLTPEPAFPWNLISISSGRAGGLKEVGSCIMAVILAASP